MARSKGRVTINLTALEDSDANQLSSDMRNLVFRGEQARSDALDRASRNMRAWKGDFWSDSELAMFKSFDITPYTFRDFRPLFNNLIHRQRSRKFTYEMVARDIHTYKRHVDAREKFIAERGDEFETNELAGDYYDKYADDEYANVITGMLATVRGESKAPVKESQAFESSLINALDVLKATYSKKHNREGSVEINRRPMNAMIWDDNSVEIDWSDCEFIGEVHLKYVDDIVQLYPEYAEQLAEHFKEYTNKDKWRGAAAKDKTFENFYKYEHGDDRLKAKIVEMWTLQTEDRIVVADLELNEDRIIEYGIEEDEVWDRLYQFMLMEIKREADETEDYSVLDDPNLKQTVIELAENRFQIGQTKEPVWYKTVFGYDVLFEHQRSPFLHASHPYYPVFCQFTNGYFSSAMDDVYDVMVALNKALMFREMMMAHGAKGLLVVNADVATQSGLDMDEIAQAYTQVGGVLMLKLKPGQQLTNALAQQSTIGDGLRELNSIIQDYDYRLQHILGVNRAQMGEVQGETPASRYRMQLAEGEGNNGLIFDNFVTALNGFYNDKVVPLVVDLIRTQPASVVRVLGEQVSPWLEVDLGERFDLFADAVRTGKYSLTMQPIEDNPQVNQARSAGYMQLAMAGAMPVETAIEFGDDPQRHRILKSMRKWQKEKVAIEAASMVDVQTIQQTAMEMGLSPEQTQELVTKLQRERYAQLEAQEGRERQMGQGMGQVQSAAAEPQRLQTIESDTLQ